ncbi:MAG: hypothetical protein M1407_05080 [Deltaproteobacteria bacterium]|nr:hypothetical protein [Deltaproteobacteria bacterium]
MGNSKKYGNNDELDILEIAFLCVSGLFALFYFSNSEFKYYIDCFYTFADYAFKYFTFVSILYLINLYLFFAGIYSLYVIIFEIKVTGAKLKMHNKLENLKKEGN